ncbi:MAG: GDSL-type esterase/lipase family protein [Patescibacteria group bacterium]
MLNKIISHPLPFLVLTLLIVVPFLTLNIVDTKKILGVKVQASPVATPTPTVAAFVTLSPKPTASPSPAPNLSKSTYNIVLYGDSMIDTMGDMKYISDALTKKYPKTKFDLYNYGIGGQNVKQGFERLNLNFSNQGRVYEAIGNIKPDVIILGTFAYNPFDPHSTDNYKNYLTPLITQIKTKGGQLYLLLEVAPLKENFGVGPHGINWPADLAQKQSQHIEEQLLAAKSVAQNMGIPIIDVYTKTKGIPSYTNTDDGIHPSYDGQVFTANLIIQTVQFK